MPRNRSYQSRISHANHSGPPSYETEFANLNSSGFDTFNALDELSLSSPTAFSAPAHTSFENYQHLPAYAPHHTAHEQALFQQYQTSNESTLPTVAHSRQHDAYWRSHATAIEERTPLPSPPLLSANSLNLPPLFPTGQDLGQHVLLSQNEPYDYPAPPDIPYAESAASAASSNLSPPEDDASPKGPFDEEKRRRNLAASARFRQKKKLREQQLEQQTKELNDRASELEERIAELEKENDFLKALLTEKETDMTSEGKRKFHEFAFLVERGEL